MSYRRLLTFGLITLTLPIVSSCGENPTEITEEHVPDGHAVTIHFGNTLSPAAQQNVSAFITVSDSAPPSTARIGIGHADQATPLLAINSRGEAILATMVSDGESSVVDPTSTAVFLSRTLLLPVLLDAPSDSAIHRSIINQPKFPDLVAVIAELANAGDSYTTSAEAVAIALDIVSGAGDQLLLDAARQMSNRLGGSVRSLATATTGPPSPIKVEELGNGWVSVSNTSFVPFLLSASAGVVEPSDAVVNGRELCLLCATPLIGVLPGKAQVKGIPDGPFSLGLQMSPTQKKDILGQIGIDFFGLVMRAAGIYATVNNSDYGPAIGLLDSKVGITSAASMKSGTEAFKAVLSGLIQAAPDLAVVLAKRSLDQGAKNRLLQSVATNLAKPLAFVDFGVWAAGRGLHYYDAYQYWEGEWPVNQCMEEQRLYDQCADFVEVSPFNPTIEGTGQVTLIASVFDSARNSLLGRRIYWQVSNDLLTPTSAEGSSPIFTVSGTGKEGTATVTARVGKVGGQAVVTVKNPWQISISGSRTVPIGAATTLNAQVRYDGNVVAYNGIIWTSRNPSIAVVAGNGASATLTARAAGKSWIVAEMYAVKDSVEVTVTSGPPIEGTWALTRAYSSTLPALVPGGNGWAVITGTLNINLPNTGPGTFVFTYRQEVSQKDPDGTIIGKAVDVLTYQGSATRIDGASNGCTAVTLANLVENRTVTYPPPQEGWTSTRSLTDQWSGSTCFDGSTFALNMGASFTWTLSRPPS